MYKGSYWLNMMSLLLNLPSITNVATDPHLECYWEIDKFVIGLDGVGIMCYGKMISIHKDKI